MTTICKRGKGCFEIKTFKRNGRYYLPYLNQGKITEVLIRGRVIFYLVLTSTKDVILNADA